MKDAEYVLRFFTVRESWENFPNNMRLAMDKHMEKHQFDTPRSIYKSRSLFTDSIEIAQGIWGNNAFKKPGLSNPRNLLLQGVY